MAGFAPEFLMVSTVILILVFVLILFQEAVNGFHDVANAIATVIYSNSLSPMRAVSLAAICNFLGVLGAGTAVAFSLVYLLPLDMVAGINTPAEASLFFAMIVSAVLWNFGTWWLAIPSSTTHAYVGSILGVSVAHAFLLGQPVAAQVHWHQGEVILMALFLSPVIGLFLGMGLLLLLRRFVKDPALYQPAEQGQHPRLWIRASLIAGSAGVSLLHGSNDGQKSIGLMMVVLFGLAPALYGLDPARLNPADQARLVDSVRQVAEVAQARGDADMLSRADQLSASLAADLKPGISPSDPEVLALREKVLALYSDVTRKMDHAPSQGGPFTQDDATLKQAYALLRDFVEHVPLWVVLLSALALGGGTAVGYQKIVKTLGEGMGSSPMNPAQGVAAQAAAMLSIGMADGGGLPVSTTHVLSSAVVGTVAGTPGQHINWGTLRRIIVTWLTTLPGTMLLSFALGIVFHLAFA